MAVIDMQTMRYINLLDKVSRVKTTKCFLYNNAIVFAVPRRFIAQAIGPQAAHIRRIQEQLGKRIKVIAEASGSADAGQFIGAVVAPVSFQSLDIADGVMTITAGSESKAALLGRNKRRYEELKTIVHDTFGLDLRIV